MGDGYFFALHFDFGVVNIASGFFAADPEFQTGFAGLIPPDQALDAQFLAVALAGGGEGLVISLNVLVVVVAVGCQGKGPVAVGKGVVEAAAPRAVELVFPVDVLVEGYVEEVIDAEQVVHGGRDRGLQLAGFPAAGVVQGKEEFPGLSLFQGDEDVAFAGFAARGDFEVHVLRGYSFHLFQALFDVAKVEEIAGTGGKSRLPVAAHGRVGETDVPDGTGDEGEFEGAG